MWDGRRRCARPCTGRRTCEASSPRTRVRGRPRPTRRSPSGWTPRPSRPRSTPLPPTPRAR
jgi:hypothetical protein